MRHNLKYSILYYLAYVLLFSFSSNSITVVHGIVESIPETSPESNINDDVTKETNGKPQPDDGISTEPPQPQEQRGGWGTSVSYHHQTHTGDENNSSSIDSATKQENNADKKISDFDGQNVPFVPGKNKQINKMPTDSEKIKPQDSVAQLMEPGSVKAPNIDISIGGGEPKDKRISHIPPDAFSLTAHIVTNPQDGQSYFTTAANDPHGPNDELLIPFLECGAVGSTTQGIPLHRAYFRHFPKLAQPTEFTPAREPHLLICLNKLEMVVSGGGDGGEKRVFERGSVILVEDMMGGGHKLYSTDSDVSVLMLTLPPSHHHGSGKEEIGRSVTGIGRRVGGGVMSLLFGKKKHMKNSKRDCLLEHDPAYSALGLKPQSDVEDDNLSFVRAIAKNAPSKRKVILTSIGLGFSTAVSVFLSKVAPLQLAVGIGGICVVGGGTMGIVKGGEWLCDEADIWMQREQQYRMEEIDIEDDEEE